MNVNVFIQFLCWSLETSHSKRTILALKLMKIVTFILLDIQIALSGLKQSSKRIAKEI